MTVTLRRRNVTRGRPVSTRAAAVSAVLLVVAALVAAFASFAAPAGAAPAPVGLGSADAYSVLGGQTVTNTGPSTLNADLGVSPGSATPGFPPGKVFGVRHAADAQALQAQADLVTGYNSAAGRAKTAGVAGDLVGKTLVAGVYKSTGPLAISGVVTLNGQGDPDAVFIFQIASTLKTATASRVAMINGAQACHVWWQVGSSATLGTTTSFQGTIMALTSISVKTGAVVKGRALARNGSVTLDNDTFTSPACDTSITAGSLSSAAASKSKAAASKSKAAAIASRSSAAASRSRAAARARSVAAGGAVPASGGSSVTLLAATGPATPISPLLVAAGLLLLIGVSLATLGNARRAYNRRH